MTTHEQRIQRFEKVVKENRLNPHYRLRDSLRLENPSRDMMEWGYFSDVYDRPGDDSPEAQSRWDKSKLSSKLTAEIKARQAAEAKASEQERAAAEATRRTAEAESIKQELLTRFLAIPGTRREEFEAAYPKLLEDHRRRVMDDAAKTDAQARVVMRPRL